jgi:hypothetical protein
MRGPSLIRATDGAVDCYSNLLLMRQTRGYSTIPPHEQRLNLRWQDAQKFNLCSWGGIVLESLRASIPRQEVLKIVSPPTKDPLISR